MVAKISAFIPFYMEVFNLLNETKETNQNDLYGQMADDVDLINTSEFGKTLLKNIRKIVVANKNDDRLMLKRAEEYTRNLRQCNP